MFQLQQDTAATRLELSGSLTIYEVGEARTLLLDALAGTPGGDWHLGLARLDELDTAGVQLLLSARRFLSAAGGSLTLADAGTPVQELLDLLRVAQTMRGQDARR